MRKSVKVAGATGFWGETPIGMSKLLEHPGLDFVVFDYLAEITMSIMARARARNANLGYAYDFVTAAMQPNLKTINDRKIRVLSNAGGLNPKACAAALEKEISAAGLSLSVAVVEGDDLMGVLEQYNNCKEMFSRMAMPARDQIISANAYLGATPIVAALNAGADIVITGRCVDSALTLAAAAHQFGWAFDDYDKISAGSLAGHLLECGPQATGGNFTDWEEAGDLAEVGYPIAEISPEGDFVISKPEGTTGVVTVGSVAEQMLYEIGDPQAYVLPDVVCDFSEVALEAVGENRVKVSHAKGRPATGELKVSLTYNDGFRAGYLFFFNGKNAADKARAYADMGLSRARKLMFHQQLPDFSEVCVETFGGAEEITLKVAVRHVSDKGVQVFLRETMGAALASPPGMHAFTGAGRPKPSPVVRLFSFLVPQSDVKVTVTLSGKVLNYEVPDVPIVGVSGASSAIPKPAVTDAVALEMVPLEELAYARSGDKGDKANIGVIARHPEFLPWIWAGLTPDVIQKVFDAYSSGAVHRYFLPGSHSMNILMDNALGGGGIASLRNDPQAKSFSQILLRTPISIPSNVVAIADQENWYEF